MVESVLTVTERKMFEGIEDSGDVQGLAWRVNQVKMDALVEAAKKVCSCYPEYMELSAGHHQADCPALRVLP